MTSARRETGSLVWDGGSGPVVLCPVDAIQPADLLRAEGLNEQHAAMLAEVEAELPPVVVHRRTMRIVDGAHRWRAAMIRGEDRIAVQWFDGDAADAFVLAVQLNHAHGLPLTRADRSRAVARILEIQPRWSDRRIGAIVGVAPGTVGAIRRRREAEPDDSIGRIGRDGRVRSQDIATARRFAEEFLVRRPDASLREVARAAGISPTTAGGIRARLRSVDEPASTADSPGPGPVTQPTALRGTRASGMIELLRRDPSLRLSDSGRALLRLLSICGLDDEQWERIVEAVPVHCRDAVAQVSRQCADSWSSFSARLTERADCGDARTG